MPAPAGPHVRGGGGGAPVPLALLHKEAAYHALAVGAYELHDHVDFSPWLRATLLPVRGGEGGGT